MNDLEHLVAQAPDYNLRLQKRYDSVKSCMRDVSEQVVEQDVFVEQLINFSLIAFDGVKKSRRSLFTDKYDYARNIYTRMIDIYNSFLNTKAREFDVSRDGVEKMLSDEAKNEFKVVSHTLAIQNVFVDMSISGDNYTQVPFKVQHSGEGYVVGVLDKNG